jgi:hypothetical protein
MWKIVKLLTTVFAAASIARLIYIGFAVEPLGPLIILLTTYDQMLDFLLGWANPCLFEILSYLSQWLPIQPKLNDHWHHVLVPFVLYISSDVGLQIEKGRKGGVANTSASKNQHFFKAIITLILGYLIALFASMMSATVELEDPSMLPVIWAIVGFVSYGLMESILNAALFKHSDKTHWQTFTHFFGRFPLVDGIMGGTIIFVGLRLTQQGIPVSNLLMLFVFVVAMALRNLLQPAFYVWRVNSNGRRFWTEYKRLSTVHHGRNIFIAIGGGVLFVAINSLFVS